MNGRDYFAEHNRNIYEKMRARMDRLEVFQASWIHVFPLVKARPICNDVDSWCRARLDEVLDEDEVRADVIAWAEANLTDYEIHESFIGINDPDAAFWFKVTWQ